jgi:serine/threonine protein kinase
LAVTGKKKIFDGRYDIISIVGRGSRSVVYHAANINDSNSSVALKVLVENKKDTTALSEKLRREALALVSCHHPYVIRLDDFHSVGDICYLAMEYANEADLRKYIKKQGGNLPVAVLQNYLKQIAEALDYIHRTGIIHRDIKPDNLLVVSDKEIRIGDFGVAYLPGDVNNASELRNAVGTFDYMAPEVLQGIEYTSRSDIYSLGISFYEAFTGSNPFEKASMSGQLDARKNLPLASTLRADIPESIAQILAKACAFEPSERYSSAKELLNALKNAESKNPIVNETSTKDSQQPSEKPANSEKQAENRPQLTVISGNAGAKSEAIVEQPSITIQENIPQTSDEQTMSSAAENIIPDRNPQIGNPASMNAGQGTFALKDSRSSRTQTVFISKDSVNQVRDQINSKPTTAKKSKKLTTNVPSVNFADLTKSISDKIQSLSNTTLFVSGLGVLFLIYLASGSFGPSTYNSHIENSSIEQGDASTDLNVPSSNTTSKASLDIKKSAVVPAYDGQALSFPNLPGGIYSGVITGVIGNTPVPMTVMSADKNNKLIFMIGLDGLNPAVVNLTDENRNNKTLKLVQNGLILEITGDIDNDAISGTVKNIGTGSIGSFKLKPSA